MMRLRSEIVFLIFALLILRLKAIDEKKILKTVSSKAFNELVFKENKGQICDQNFMKRSDILFSANDNNYSFYLLKNSVSYQLKRVDTWMEKAAQNLGRPERCADKSPGQITVYRLDLKWLNANQNLIILNQQALESYDNYYLESCPEGAVKVKSYRQIIYKRLYEGIDLKWHEKNGQLKYDYMVAAGADYKQIKLKINGATKLSIGGSGELIIETPLGNIAEEKPIVLQDGKELQASWIIKGDTVSFEISSVNAALPFVIDPLVRVWGTYFGGTAEETFVDTNVDNANNVYVTRETKSTTNIATTGVAQTTFGGYGYYWGDAFITKFNSSGIKQWATYYGGATQDHGDYSFTDPLGNVYMVGGTGATNSLVIATPGAHQTAPSGGGNTSATADAFLVKFNASGIRIWGTYYGGSGFEYAVGGVVDASGNIYICGTTTSTNGISIAKLGSFKTTNSVAIEEAFLVKFTSSGTRIWGTYYGGQCVDFGNMLSCDNNGNIYLTGSSDQTSVGNISTPGCHQPILGGYTDAFLVKFDPAGLRLWATYYGGQGNDFGSTCYAKNNDLYLSGVTTSNGGTAIATQGSHQSTFAGGGYDAFLVKFDLAGIRD